jgi:hypothetical protein
MTITRMDGSLWLSAAIAAAVLWLPGAGRAQTPCGPGPAAAALAGALAEGHHRPGAAFGAAANAIVGSTRCQSAPSPPLAYAPPPAPFTLRSYRSGLQQAAYPQGAELVIQSAMSFSGAADAQPHNLIEDYMFLAPDGHQKHFAKRVSGIKGEMSNSLTVNLPPALPHGDYQVRTTLVVDGRPQASNLLHFHLG